MQISTKKLGEKMAAQIIDPKELCRKAAISYPTFKRAWNNSNVKISTVGKICRALDCDPAELISCNDNAPDANK